MANIALLLGPVLFRDFEVPSGIVFGGRQRLAVHRLPGGSRVIDAMGRDEGDISFSGIFTGADATVRARSLDVLRASGLALPLTWDVFFYSVLIAEFRANYQNGWWIPYRVTCSVIQDEAAGLLPMTAPIAALIEADIGTAITYSSGTGVDLSSLGAALSAQGTTQRGSADYTAAQTDILAAQASLSSSTYTAESQFLSAQSADTTSASGAVDKLLSATTAAGQLSLLNSASAYVNRLSVNLTNAST